MVDFLLSADPHELAVEELTRGRDQANRLRVLLCSAVRTSCPELEAEERLDQVLRSFSALLSLLERCRVVLEDKMTAPAPPEDNDCSIAASSPPPSSADFTHPALNSCPERNKRTSCRTQRNNSGTIRCTAVMAFHDGYLWRKYGQKRIKGSDFPRSYYRCAYSDDDPHRCKAIKQLQQTNDNDPPTYSVAYFREHTCHQQPADTHRDLTGSASSVPSAGSCNQRLLIFNSKSITNKGKRPRSSACEKKVSPAIESYFFTPSDDGGGGNTPAPSNPQTTPVLGKEHQQVGSNYSIAGIPACSEEDYQSLVRSAAELTSFGHHAVLRSPLSPLWYDSPAADFWTCLWPLESDMAPPDGLQCWST